MRAKSSVIASAAVVAFASGLANAAVIDSFTTAQVGAPDSDIAVSGGLFSARGLWTGASVDTVTQSLQLNAVQGWSTWHNEDWSGIDFTTGRPDGFQISFDYTTNASIYIDILDISRNHSVGWEIQAGSGTANLTVSSYAGAVDFTQIIQIGLYADTATGSISNFTITPIPAPGAFALLGAAGLVRSRRRR